MLVALFKVQTLKLLLYSEGESDPAADVQSKRLWLVFSVARV